MEDMPAMKNVRFAVFGLALTALVAAAVSGLVAQSQSEPRRMQVRPRALMLDGRGGQLGVVVADLDAEGLKSAAGATSGVRIEDVEEDGPAAKAGLREGDIVVDVDGDRVRSARQFARLIQETPEGRSVALGIVRDGKRQAVTVTPESRAFAGFDGDDGLGPVRFGSRQSYAGGGSNPAALFRWARVADLLRPAGSQLRRP